MRRVLVIAPHPDDETLGCGGTLYRLKDEGCTLYWVIVTSVSAPNWSTEVVKRRAGEIKIVGERYGFAETHEFDFPTTTLDQIPLGDIVDRFSKIFQSIGPDTVFVPHRSDIHSDHRVVFDAATAGLKWFRNAAPKRILAYETLSETEQALAPQVIFQPQVFFDITSWIENKIDTMRLYKSEMGDHPFPRSEKSIRAQAQFRGLKSGAEYAEAFMLLKEYN